MAWAQYIPVAEVPALKWQLYGDAAFGDPNPRNPVGIWSPYRKLGDEVCGRFVRLDLVRPLPGGVKEVWVSPEGEWLQRADGAFRPLAVDPKYHPRLKGLLRECLAGIFRPIPS
jgi:hypothetical protein